MILADEKLPHRHRLVANAALPWIERVVEFIDEHARRAVGAEVPEEHRVLRGESGVRGVAQFEEHAGRILAPQAHLPILHQVVVESKAVPRHVARGKERIAYRAEALQRHHAGSVDLLVGFFLAWKVRVAVEKRAARIRVDEFADLLVLPGERVSPGRELREFAQRLLHDEFVSLAHPARGNRNVDDGAHAARSAA